jgi:para-nitrobenzyl esterase
MASIDRQDVVRMNRDTLYSSGVFDLDAGVLTITLPDAGKRFMSMKVVSQDHYTTEVVYGPGIFTYTRTRSERATPTSSSERSRTPKIRRT